MSEMGEQTGLALTRRAVLAGGAGFIVCTLPEVSVAAEPNPKKGLRRIFGSSKKIVFDTKTTPRQLSRARATQTINHVRAERGRPPVRAQSLLQRAAQWQASEMARRDAFAHTLGPGLSLRQRMDRLGYRGIFAENLARTYETFEEALLAWMKSPSHRTTLLSERYTRFGAAAAVVPRNRESEYRYYWAIIFGNV